MGHRKSSGGQNIRDRSVLRVAASLFDEKCPADSEIASEAKLSRQVKSDIASPRNHPFSSPVTTHHQIGSGGASGQQQHQQHLPKHCGLEDDCDYGDLPSHLEYDDGLSSLSSGDEDDDLLSSSGAVAGGGELTGPGVLAATAAAESAAAGRPFLVGGAGSRTGGSSSRSVCGASDGEVEMMSSNEPSMMVGVEGAASGEVGVPTVVAKPTGSSTTASQAGTGSLSSSMPTPSNFAKRGAQWTNFRSSPRARSSARTSPGLERIYHRPRTPGPVLQHSQHSSSLGPGGPSSSSASPLSSAVVDTSADAPTHQSGASPMPISGGGSSSSSSAASSPAAPLLMSPSMWTFVRHGKRKLGAGGFESRDGSSSSSSTAATSVASAERYEPYATSAAKRRAVSPIAYLASVSSAASAAAAAANLASASNGSGGTLGQHHHPIAVALPNTGSGRGGGGNGYPPHHPAAAAGAHSAASSPSLGAVAAATAANGLPHPTPLSMPSSTNPAVQPFWAAGVGYHLPHHHHRTLSNPFGLINPYLGSRSASAFATAAHAASASSRSGSPATRPSTPTNLGGPTMGSGHGFGTVTTSGGSTPTTAPPALPFHLVMPSSSTTGTSPGPGPSTTTTTSTTPGCPSSLTTSMTMMPPPSPYLLATQTPGSAGSGPGYGSTPAALGLSLGGNSAARTRDEEEEEGTREGVDEGVRMMGLS
ncbi:hypothetical protein V8E36_004429 [Tilletia maclaganii]